MPEGEAGVRCVPRLTLHPLCPGCGLLIDAVNPCPHQLSAQDSMLLAAQKLGLALDAEVPDDQAPPLWTP